MKLTLKESKKAQGFSLVELLVVIAIIGILAAFAVPQLKSVMEKSKISTCKSNAKKIENAVQQALMMGACNEYASGSGVNKECFAAHGICQNSDDTKSNFKALVDEGAIAKAVEILRAGCQITDSKKIMSGANITLSGMTDKSANEAYEYLSFDSSTGTLNFVGTPPASAKDNARKFSTFSGGGEVGTGSGSELASSGSSTSSGSGSSSTTSSTDGTDGTGTATDGTSTGASTSGGLDQEKVIVDQYDPDVPETLEN